MAKITGPLMSSTASGSIAETLTFSKKRTGQQVRIQRKQKDVITPARTAQRNLYSEALSEWRSFSFSVKSAYELEAYPKKITGFNLFVKKYLLNLFSFKGLTWSDLGQKFSQTYIYSLSYLGNGICLAGTGLNGKILRSTDYGLTWSDLGQKFSETYILSLSYLGNGICLAGTGPNGKILRSTDYGLTWSDLGQKFSQAQIRSLSYLGNGICLAGTGLNGKILRSTD